MITLSTEQIKEIAGQLDCGLNCFYNKNTHEIRSILDFDSHAGADEEPWQEEIDEIDEHYDEYVSFRQMESFESFKIMEAFADEVDDYELKGKLFLALSKKHPFANFKNIIDFSGPYRQIWFDFKEQKYIEYVERSIKEINFSEENRDVQEDQEE